MLEMLWDAQNTAPIIFQRIFSAFCLINFAPTASSLIYFYQIESQRTVFINLRSCRIYVLSSSVLLLTAVGRKSAISGKMSRFSLASQFPLRAGGGVVNPVSYWTCKWNDIHCTRSCAILFHFLSWQLVVLIAGTWRTRARNEWKKTNLFSHLFIRFGCCVCLMFVCFMDDVVVVDVPMFTQFTVYWTIKNAYF